MLQERRKRTSWWCLLLGQARVHMASQAVNVECGRIACGHVDRVKRQVDCLVVWLLRCNDFASWWRNGRAALLLQHPVERPLLHGHSVIQHS
jgi:hypothetical protein